jgi:triosephosphate isomerase
MQPGLNGVPGVEKVLCPPFTALAAVKELLESTAIKLGAQGMHWEEKGAYTGEISPLMLKGLCQYVILGHSERRQYFGETDDRVNKKIKAALAHNLTPIVCVGENLAQNEARQTEAVVGGQVRGCLAGLNAEQVRRLIIAYEPIWAIGTGKPATGVGANAVIGQTVRGTVRDLYGEVTAQAVRIQYGGSVNPKNIAEFMSQVEIDGALVGGASLKTADFVEIVRISAKVKEASS